MFLLSSDIFNKPKFKVPCSLRYNSMPAFCLS